MWQRSPARLSSAFEPTIAISWCEIHRLANTDSRRGAAVRAAALD
jgi:hypothetical protein